MDDTPRKWSEQRKGKGAKGKENQKKAALETRGKGDSESDGESSTVSEYSIRPNGARLRKDPVVNEQRKKWKEHLANLANLEAVAEQLQNEEDAKIRFRQKLKWTFFALVFLIALVPAGYYSYQMYYADEAGLGLSGAKPSASIVISWEEGQSQFTRAVTSLSKKYPNQDRETWVQLLASVRSTLDKAEPTQPTSVVLLTPPTLDSGFTPCLAREIGRAAHSVFYNVTRTQFTQKILELDSDYFNNAASVTEIHDRLQTYLKNGKVIVIKNPHLVNQQERLMVYHAFCDNTAAPDKRATFLFIVPVPARVYGKYAWSSAEGFEIASEVLGEAWTSLTADKKPALIARVAASTVLIKPGDRCADI